MSPGADLRDEAEHAEDDERGHGRQGLHHVGQRRHELAKRAAFGKAWGIVYRLYGTRVDCTIYSLDDLDVTPIATRYGGGGHRNAAGFSVTLEQWLSEFA